MASQNENTGLVKFLQQRPNGDPSFPQASDNYYQRFLTIEHHLNTQVHTKVNQGAAANRSGWLTDHGPDHVTTVIRRASDLTMLTSSDDSFLSPYEVYLLLLAIHFHDVGNVFGRKQHERKIAEVMHTMGSALLGHDAGEHRLFHNIATAHGGYVDVEETDKDTIGPLRLKWPVQTNGPRAQLLAAILRFADELADDCTRTSRFLLTSNALAHESEVYHVYADRLREVAIRPEENVIHMRFEVTCSDLQRKFGKGDGEMYLFDEIALRALKMHHEHLYCSRFLLPHILIDTISVTINISSDISPDRFITPLRVVAFNMQQVGYPKLPVSISELDPNLRGLDGETLRNQVAELEKR